VDFGLEAPPAGGDVRIGGRGGPGHPRVVGAQLRAGRAACEEACVASGRRRSGASARAREAIGVYETPGGLEIPGVRLIAFARQT